MVTPRRPGFDSWRGLAVFAFTFRLVLRLARPPGQRSPPYISLKLKWLERDCKLRMPSIRLAMTA